MISSLVRILVMTATMIGISQMMVMITISAYNRILTAGGRVLFLAIVFLPRDTGEVEEYKNQADHEQNHRDGGAVTHTIVVEGLDVHVVSQNAGGIEGSSPGHHRYQVEGPEGIDDADHDDDHRHRCELGKNHVKKALDPVGSVHI